MFYLVSFPRAGSTWIRLFFEKYTGVPSGSAYETSNWDGPILHTGKDRCMVRAHEFRHIQPVEGDKVVLMLRDPLNVIPSYLKYHGRPVAYSGAGQVIADYVKLVNIYCNYGGDKTVVYYEDFVVDFEREIIKLLEYLEMEVRENEITQFDKSNDENFNIYLNYFWKHKKWNNVEHDKDVFNRKRVFTYEQRLAIKKKFMLALSDEGKEIMRRYL